MQPNFGCDYPQNGQKSTDTIWKHLVAQGANQNLVTLLGHVDSYIDMGG